MTVKLLTKNLSVEGYGELSLSMTIATFSAQLLLGPLGQGFQRYYSVALEKNSLNDYWKAINKLLLSTALIILSLTLLTPIAAIISSSINQILIIVALLFSIIDGLNSNYIGIQNAARKRISAVSFSIISIWARLGLAVFLLNFISRTPTTVLIAYCIVGAVVTFFQFNLLYKYSFSISSKQDKSSINYRNEILKFSYPFATWGVFTWLQLSSERWSLELFWGSKEVAQYAVLYQLGYAPVTMIASFMLTLIAPIVFNKIGSGENQLNKQAGLKMLYYLIAIAFVLSIVAFLVAFFFHSFIFKLFLDPRYFNISYLLPFIVLSGGIFATGQIISLKFASNMQTSKMIAPKIITALVGIALNYTMCYFWGVKGIIIASLIFATLYAFWMFFLTYNKSFYSK